MISEKMNISKVLKARRLELKITQAALAHYLGYKSKMSVCYLESGRSIWTFEKVLKACKPLKLKVRIEFDNPNT